MKIQKLTKTSDQTSVILIASCLILFAVFSRLLPHPPNVAPIAAVAIFGGAVLPRKWALSLPLAAMVASDLIIGLHPLIMYTWGSFVLIALLSSRYLNKIQTYSVAGASVGASLLFYLVTNFGVWAQGQMYPPTLGGLLNCYYMGLPFLRNTMAGDLLFTSAMFLAYVAVRKLAQPRVKVFA